jgi:L-alanine-DL-glutamate epimerase-like enolase superfamily enzyme/uncharacterized membrane protein YfcA
VQLALVCTGAAVGGAIFGVIGFAYGVLISLFIHHAFAAPDVVFIVVGGAFILNLFYLPRFWREIRWRGALPYMAGATLGLPLGLWLLTQLDARTVRSFVAILIVAYGLFALRQQSRAPFRFRGAHGNAVDGTIGFVGGVIGGVSGLGPLVPGVWFGLRGFDKVQQRSLAQPFGLYIQGFMVVWLLASSTVRPQRRRRVGDRHADHARDRVSRAQGVRSPEHRGLPALRRRARHRRGPRPPREATVRIDAWLLRLPLVKPYRLAFGPVEALDTVVVRVARDDGAEGYGEATLLTGYTDETIGETWAKVGEVAGALRSPSFDLGATLDGLDASHPFLTTAFRTAMEMADESPSLSLDAPARVPILGLLQGESEDRLRVEADALVAQGYRTLKVKVGFDAARDAAMVAMAQRAVAGRARIRIDANQGYSAGEAIEFVSRLASESIELFEQPCAAGDWEAHAKVVPVARDRGIPLMLDESIYSEREIVLASERGAAGFIKVKLMKFCSLARLERAIALIRDRGRTPVLGNGVATDLGCWMEACVAARHIDNAGEMNGFLKPRERLLADPLVFREGAIELPARWRPRIDTAALDRLALARINGVGVDLS